MGQPEELQAEGHAPAARNATHVCTTDPEARLFRKGNAHEAKLYYQGHVGPAEHRYRTLMPRA